MVTMETRGSDVNSIFGLFSPKYPYGEIFMAIQPIIILIMRRMIEKNDNFNFLTPDMVNETVLI